MKTDGIVADLAIRAPDTHLLSGNVNPDGSLWSHAAEPGAFMYDGEPFSVSLDVFDHMVSVFRTGYPRKAPVDYEHEMFVDPRARSAAVPYTTRAGDVIELKVVRSDADLDPMMQKQADDERTRRKSLGLSDEIDTRGLWVRWIPTARALALVKQREITEMSISFHPDYPHKVTGEGQGPTFLGVALTNTPFLDNMVPVAATRGKGGTGPGCPEQENANMTETLKQPGRVAYALSVLLGRATPFTSDEDAADAARERITTLGAEVQTLTPKARGFDILAAEIGETDPGKALLSVQSLKAAKTAADKSATDAKSKSVEQNVALILKAYETRIPSKPARDHFAASLKRDLEAGQEPGKTATEAVLTSLSAAPNLGQHSAGDTGNALSSDPDTRIDVRAKELMASDDTIKEIRKAQGFSAAFREAVVRASRDVQSGKGTTTAEVVTA